MQKIKIYAGCSVILALLAAPVLAEDEQTEAAEGFERLERVLTAEAAVCPAEADERGVLRVTFAGIRNATGNLQINLYGPEKDEFLEGGMSYAKLVVPAQEGEVTVCIPLPVGPGRYALAMTHDENLNRKFDVFEEGYGFSNNAKAGMFGPPSFKKARFEAVAGFNDMKVDLRY